MSSVSIFNGERVVVLLFVSRVLSAAVPHSLTYEAFTLFLLAFAALFVEIFVENSTSFTPFKTRPGASSGILLGAVTLPSVMLSRSIQLSRAIQSKDIEPQELDYLILQYWAVSASCFGVLLFLCFILQHSTDAISYFRLPSFQDTNFSLFYTAFFAAVSSLYLAMRCDCGSHIAIKLFWVFCHGLAAVRLIENILHTFPSCVSLGEALLVTSGLVLYFGDMLLQTLAKVNTYLVSSELASVQFGIKRSEIGTIIQGVLIGLLIFPLCYKFILRIYDNMSILFNVQSPEAEKKTFEVIEKSLVFYAALMLTVVVIAPAWMQFVVHFDSHPLLWVFNFVFEDPLKRLALCIYWITVICASVLRFYNISKSSTIERILLRKYYHLVAVLMFSPALVFQPSFTDLAFGAALAVFLVLEIIRVWNIWPLGKHVHQFMSAFTDHRDSDLLIVSHFSLLLGCALPKWMSYGFNDRPLAPFAGILSLGIGDTMASMVGHKYGVLRWSKTGKKTIEGTAAGITSVLAACSVLLPLIASSAYIHSQHWVSLLVAVTGSGLLEAYTAQLDNAFIPLVFYSLLCL